MPTICPKCGSTVIDGHVFCNNCGQRLTPLSGPSFIDEQDGDSALSVPEKDLPPFLRDMGGPGPRGQSGAPLGRLVVRTGEAAGAEYELDHPQSLIGRTPESDVFVNDKLVSRRHAQITRVGNSYMLEDLNSSNGTFLNGQRLTSPQPLHARDTIQVGTTSLLFQMEAEPELATEPEPKGDFGTMLVGDEPAIGPGGSTVAFLPEEAEPVEQEHGWRPRFESVVPAESRETAVIEPEYLTVPAPEVTEEEWEESEPEPMEAAPVEEETAILGGAESPASQEAEAEAAAEAEPLEEEEEAVAVEAEPDEPPVSAEDVSSLVADSASQAQGVRDGLSEAAGRAEDLSELAEAIRQAVTAQHEKVGALVEELNRAQSRLEERESYLGAVQAAADQSQKDLGSANSQLDAVTTDRDRLRDSLTEAAQNLRSLSDRITASSQQMNLGELAALVKDVVANPRDIDYASALARRASVLAELVRTWQEVAGSLGESTAKLDRLAGE